MKSVAFPAISCGVYGYPLAEAARVALGEVITFLANDRQLDSVIFVLFDERAYDAFERAYRDLLGPGAEAGS